MWTSLKQIPYILLPESGFCKIDSMDSDIFPSVNFTFGLLADFLADGTCFSQVYL